MKNLIQLIAVALLICFSTVQAVEQINISDFSQQSLSDWQEKEFSGKTRYQFIQLKGRTVLQAISNQSASGLFKEVHIDLNKTPYLNWSWSVNSQLKGIDEQTKAGDDYSARLYVVKKHSFLFWKTKALNYVWSSNQKKLTHWDNAFTSQAKMLAVRGEEDATGKWYHEKRNVKEDLKRFFGVDIDSIDVLAIMTDTDNSKLSVSASYGEIYFSAQ